MNINPIKNPIKKKIKRRRKSSPSKDYFVKEKIENIDYRDVMVLRRFISYQGRIMPQVFSKLMKKHQKKVSLAIKRARQMALIPYEIQLQNPE